MLEQQQLGSPQQTQLSLDAAPEVEAVSTELHPVLEQLAEISPENLTPRQALDVIYQLKELL